MHGPRDKLGGSKCTATGHPNTIATLKNSPNNFGQRISCQLYYTTRAKPYIMGFMAVCLKCKINFWLSFCILKR